jgi:hypothetical protein
MITMQSGVAGKKKALLFYKDETSVLTPWLPPSHCEVLKENLFCAMARLRAGSLRAPRIVPAALLTYYDNMVGVG